MPPSASPVEVVQLRGNTRGAYSIQAAKDVNMIRACGRAPSELLESRPIPMASARTARPLIRFSRMCRMSQLEPRSRHRARRRRDMRLWWSE